MDIPSEDLRVDAYAASGPLGRRSAVRVTHLPTGIVVEVDEGDSQIENRTRALARLREILDRRSADGA